VTLKDKDDPKPLMAELERLLGLTHISKQQRGDLERELEMFRAGIAGEKEAAYHIDFHWKGGKNSAVIHDLRIEHGGRVAQIDHLIVMRTLECHVIESKGFNSQVRVSDGGEWEAKTRFGWKGIPSPVEQNRRHIEVLQTLIRDHALAPKRLGMSMRLRFHNWVLVSPRCKLNRKGGDWDKVVKMDMFEKRFGECVDEGGFLDTLASISKLVSAETIDAFARSLVATHKPLVCDFAARFGITSSTARHLPAEQIGTRTVDICCDKCSAVIDAQVVKYCRSNLQRFRGEVLCRSCQTTAPTGIGCAQCGCQVDQKVAAFCRFNSARFAKKVLCRSCQPKMSAS
jgi:Nuclease-related domain